MLGSVFNRYQQQLGNAANDSPLKSVLRTFHSGKDTIGFSEFLGIGPPKLGVGVVGDIYLDLTPDALTLYGRYEDEWRKWHGPEDISHPVIHPNYPKRWLWCNDTVYGWFNKSHIVLHPGKSQSDVLSQARKEKEQPGQGESSRKRKHTGDSNVESTPKRPHISHISVSPSPVTSPRPITVEHSPFEMPQLEVVSSPAALQITGGTNIYSTTSSPQMWDPVSAYMALKHYTESLVAQLEDTKTSSTVIATLLEAANRENQRLKVENETLRQDLALAMSRASPNNNPHPSEHSNEYERPSIRPISPAESIQTFVPEARETEDRFSVERDSSASDGRAPPDSSATPVEVTRIVTPEIRDTHDHISISSRSSSSEPDLTHSPIPIPVEMAEQHPRTPSSTRQNNERSTSAQKNNSPTDRSSSSRSRPPSSAGGRAPKVDQLNVSERSVEIETPNGGVSSRRSPVPNTATAECQERPDEVVDELAYLGYGMDPASDVDADSGIPAPASLGSRRGSPPLHTEEEEDEILNHSDSESEIDMLLSDNKIDIPENAVTNVPTNNEGESEVNLSSLPEHLSDDGLWMSKLHVPIMFADAMGCLLCRFCLAQSPRRVVKFTKPELLAMQEHCDTEHTDDCAVILNMTEEELQDVLKAGNVV